MKDFFGEHENPNTQLKSPEYCFGSAFRRVPRYIIVTFVSAFVLGFLVHGFMFANKLPNHDDINHLFGSDYGVASGRWLLPFLLHLDGEISSPWVIGSISVLFLSVSACLTASVLRLRSVISCILLAAIMVSFPAVGSTFTYMFSADAYFLSLMLSCLAAFLTVKYRFGFIGGIIAIALSLGIYQSYFGVAAVLLVIALILEVLGDTPRRELLFKALKCLATLALGMVLYFVIVKLTTRNDVLVDYMGIAEMGRISISDLPRLITDAYKSYYRFYIYDARGIHFGYMPFVFGLLALATLVPAIAILRKKRLKAARIAILVLLVILMPLAGAIIYVMVPNAEVHELMVYGLSFILIAPLVIYEYWAKLLPPSEKGNLSGIACWVIVLSLALFSYNYGIYTNEAYMKMSLSYEQAASYSTRLLSAIESYEKYDENATVVLVGKALQNVEFKPSPELEEINMTGAINTESIINSYSYGYYLRYYMGASNIIYATESPLSKNLALNPIIEAMPSYPSSGSIALVDGYIVVKLSGRVE